MTQDEIVVMAVNAGLVKWEVLAYKNELEAFAKLVEEKTRRDLREEIVYTWVPPRFVDLAVESEREACANLCEESNDMVSSYGLAQAIRARGEA